MTLEALTGVEKAAINNAMVEYLRTELGLEGEYPPADDQDRTQLLPHFAHNAMFAMIGFLPLQESYQELSTKFQGMKDQGKPSLRSKAAARWLAAQVAGNQDWINSKSTYTYEDNATKAPLTATVPQINTAITAVLPSVGFNALRKIRNIELPEIQI